MVKKIEATVDSLYEKLDRLYHNCHIIFDVLFYVSFMAFLLVAILCDCEQTFRMHILLKPYVKQFVLILDHWFLPILAGTALLFEFKEKKMRLIAFFSLYILMLYQVNAEENIIGIIPHCNVYYFGVGCLVVAAKGRDFRRIGWVYVIVHTGFMLLITTLAVMGNIPDLVFEEFGRAGRHSLGMHYPLNYAAHWFSIALIYCYVKDGFMKIWDYVLGIVLGCVCAFVCKAQTSTVLFGILIAGTMFRQVSKRNGRTMPFHWSINGKDVLSYVLEYSFVFMAMFMIAGAMLYVPPISSVLKRISVLGTFFSRFEFGRIGLMNYFPSMLGVDYPTSTWNGTVKSANYFFIDCSYISMLLGCGIVIFAIVMVVLWYIPHRLRLKHNKYGLFVLAVWAVMCAMEHHILDVSFDPFLLMTFATLSDKMEKSENMAEV